MSTDMNQAENRSAGRHEPNSRVRMRHHVVSMLPTRGSSGPPRSRQISPQPYVGVGSAAGHGSVAFADRDTPVRGDLRL